MTKCFESLKRIQPDLLSLDFSSPIKYSKIHHPQPKVFHYIYHLITGKAGFRVIAHDYFVQLNPQPPALVK